MVRRWAVVAAVALVGCESLRKPAPPPTEPTSAPLTLVSLSRDSTSPPGMGERCKAASLPLSSTRPQSHHLSPIPGGEVAEPSAAREAGEGASVSPDATADPLTLAAECLNRGDRVTAATHLEAYVRRHPDQLMFRVQLAELLVRLGRDEQARLHFERFADDARTANAAMKDHLVHVHTRLMEIAQRKRDDFAELYHRGVGLLLLLAEEDANQDRDPAFCEEMACKAVKTLAEAKELKPSDARVRAHLADALERTGNRRAAEAERTAAKGNAVGGAGIVLPR